MLAERRFCIRIKCARRDNELWITILNTSAWILKLYVYVYARTTMGHDKIWHFLCVAMNSWWRQQRTQVWHIARSSLALEHTFPIYSNICLFRGVKHLGRPFSISIRHTLYSRKAMTIIFVRLRPVWHWQGAHLTSARSRVKIDWYGSYNGHGPRCIHTTPDSRIFHIIGDATARLLKLNDMSRLFLNIYNTPFGFKDRRANAQLLASDAQIYRKISYVSYKSRKIIQI